MRLPVGVTETIAVPLQEGIIPRGTMVDVFEEIYIVFLVLGTLVGVVVIGYMIYLALEYRDTGDASEGDIDRPRLGELPTGSGGGRKLFVSLALSAIIVISLIAWTYGTLLYVEGAPASEGQEDFEVHVTGYQFGWEFKYPNGHTTTDELRVPQGERVTIEATSRDVWHNFGIPAFNVKTDAIPGQTTEAWFVADETGTYQAVCYELCGAGHSAMNADVIVMKPAAFEAWYANTSSSSEGAGARSNGTAAGGSANGTNGSGTANESAMDGSAVGAAGAVVENGVAIDTARRT